MQSFKIQSNKAHIYNRIDSLNKEVSFNKLQSNKFKKQKFQNYVFNGYIKYLIS